jgi:cytochrome o ubiquinol oxidase subunit 1
MIFASALLGKLSWHVFPKDIVTLGAFVSIVAGGILVAALLTYFKKWGYLWREWLTNTDHKKIGVMYVVLSILMLIRGGVDALMMRAQQATAVGASHGVLSSSTFQQVFSAHGTIMIFFAAMGLMFGIINLVLPLQIGSRDVAFPFLNLTSFWLFAAGAILINLSLGIGNFSAAGWLAYPPLSELRYSPSVGIDYWIWTLEVAGIGSLMSGINFLTTIIKNRAPGMTLMKMPLFSWSVLCAMFLVIFAFPILTVTVSLLFLDRTLGTHFFTAGGGGNMMMYVNLIWAWGHPEVYILILPAFGVFSEIVSTFSRKKLFGYRTMVMALAAITVLSFSVWVHHFFTMGAGADVNGFFGIMTMVIAIPTGVKIFNWLFTMYKGKIHFNSALYWFFGFVILFTIGGVAGVIMAIPAADFQLHNSLFLVAHFHTMIVSGVLFGYFAGFTYWFPKIFGYRLDEKLGIKTFYLWVIGFVLAFFPLYILGFLGATRRINHYAANLGWQPLFVVAGIGAVIIAGGVAMGIWQQIVSYRRRQEYKDKTGDPWNGRTIEWSIPSPAPYYNFKAIPVIHDRDAFWVAKQNHQDLVSDDDVVDIILPKRAPASFILGMCALVFGFAMIWHIWWLVIVSLIVFVVILMVRLNDEKPYDVVRAEDILAHEKSLKTGNVV